MASTSIEVSGVWDAALDSALPELPLATAHVWKRNLHGSDAEVAACHALLSNEEREKASRYRVERPRTDYILTRGTLRSLLSKYLRITPQDISFRYTQYGKPFLANECDLAFNVSHCEGLALLAFTRKRDIGVDVEKFRPQTDAWKLAERFFSLREREALRPLSGDELHTAFFRCWTRKEAYIKAKGEGLSLPLHQFDVSIEPDPEDALIATRPDPAEASRWMLRNLQTNPGYAAALAIGR
ncbi:MAG: 4'-phosphopantetheinyl transferase superfamily protein [Candidatus Sulfotelmatobacter sp.]